MSRCRGGKRMPRRGRRSRRTNINSKGRHKGRRRRRGMGKRGRRSDIDRKRRYRGRGRISRGRRGMI